MTSAYFGRNHYACVISGNKSGNRRTANIRSIGHSDLFSLSKEDLTDVLSEFPAAKRHLEEKGRQILTKMGMLEENGEVGEEEAATVETKINNLEINLESLHTKLARLMVELESSNVMMQVRVKQLELEVAAMHTHHHLSGEKEDVQEDQGRGEGVGLEVELEREEAEGEEEWEAPEVMKPQRQREDVANEGDGESTKSTPEDVRKIEENNSSGLKDPEFPEQKQENVGKNIRKEGNERPGKGDVAEIEPAGESGDEESEMKKKES